MSYWKSFWRESLSSWRLLNLGFLKVLGFELVFYLAVSGVFLLFRNVFESLGQKYSAINLGLVSEQTLSGTRTFFLGSIGLIFGFLLALFVVYSVLQAAVWLVVLKKRPDKKFFAKFILSNLVWVFAWFLLSWFVSVGLKGAYAVAGLFVFWLLFTHLTYVFQRSIVLEPKKSVGSLVGGALGLGFGKIHRFLPAYVFAFAVLFAWGQVWRLVPSIESLGISLFVLSLLIFAPFFAWLKIYFGRSSALT